MILPVFTPTFLPSSGLFDPKNLVVQGGFWRADAGIALSGANVTQWTDQSSNAWALTPAIGVSPTWASNSFNTSFNGVTFNGVSGTNASGQPMLNVAGAVLNTTTVSVFVLVNTTTASPLCSNGRFVAYGTGATHDDTVGTSFCTFMNSSGGTNNCFFSNGTFSAGTGSALGLQSLGWVASTSSVTEYSGFSSTGTTSLPSTSNFGVNNTDEIALGSSMKFASSAMHGVMAYALVTSKSLTAGDITNLKTWTNAHWGTSF